MRLIPVQTKKLEEGKRIRDSESDNCPICFEKYHVSDSDAHQMPCGHFMHDVCFEDYTRCFDKCPLCKKPFEIYSDN